jgi:DNA-directed RNA polymerase specialized sigma24 family protein
MGAADVAAIDAATAARLLREYRPLLRRAQARYGWLDQHELRAVWEDAVCEAFATHVEHRATEATWVARVFRWRLTALVQRSRTAPSLLGAPLGIDPQVVNGINPERAFFEGAAMEELLQLPPRQQIILLAHLHGYTYAEVAEQVGIGKSRAQEEGAAGLAEIRRRLVLGSKERT